MRRLPIPATARGRAWARRAVFAVVMALVALFAVVVFVSQSALVPRGSNTVTVAVAAVAAGSTVLYGSLLIYLLGAGYRPRPVIEWLVAVLVVGGSIPIVAEFGVTVLGVQWPVAMVVTTAAAAATLPLFRRHIVRSVRLMLRNHVKSLRDPADAHAMIQDAERVLADAGLDVYEVHTARINLARALVAGSSTTDSPGAVLVRATAELEKLLADPPEDWLSVFTIAAELVEAMELKADTYGDLTGYAEALAVLAAAADRMPSDFGASSHLCHSRAAYQLELANRASGDEARRHLDAAISDLRQALATATRVGRAALPGLCAKLGLALGTLDRPDAREEGIAWCRQGQRLVRGSPRARVLPDLALASLLTDRATVVADTVNLDTPAPERDQAARTVAADLHHALRLCRRARRRASSRLRLDAREQLAIVFSFEHMWFEGADGAKVAAAWRAAALEAAHSSLPAMVRVASSWVAWATGTEVAAWCAEAHQHLMALIPRVAAVRYLAPERDRLLAEVQHTADEAGYWLLQQDQLRDAVVALELGRAVSISEAMARDRPDLPEFLINASQPELADRYRRAVARLQHAEHAEPGNHRGYSSPVQRAWAEYDSVLRAVAKVDGAERMVTPVSYAEVASAAAEGPVVYLAATERYGYAVVIPARDVEPDWIPLPSLTRDGVREQVDRLLKADQDGNERERVIPVLRWLWEHGVGGLARHLPPDALVTLIPVGLLGLLPVHAAGGPEGRDFEPERWTYLADRVVVRYAPNARTLVRARERAAACERSPLALLAVDAPDGIPGQPLDHTRQEIEAVAGHWRAAGRAVDLAPGAPVAEVRGCLPRYPVWHIACHCVASPDAILDSALYLAGGTLTLRELLELPPSPRRLAVLAACQSHRSSQELPDEAMGLPGGLLQIGLAGVVATHWSTDDRAAVFLTARFHELWQRHGLPPPRALAEAQRWLRDATNGELSEYLPGVLDPPPERTLWAQSRSCAHPYRWAPFAMSGA